MKIKKEVFDIIMEIIRWRIKGAEKIETAEYN